MNNRKERKCRLSVGEALTKPLRWRKPSHVDMFKGRLMDRNGADPAEWPEDLRVREWPENYKDYAC